MSLTVLSVAYPFAPVGPDCVGGAEQILTDLDHALVAAGHSSLVLACEGSAAAGKLIPFPPLRNALDSPNGRQWCRAQLQALLDHTLSGQQVDLIHMHGFDFYEYTLPPHIPTLVTLHLPIRWYPSQIWNGMPPGLQLQFVSETQRLSSPAALSGAPVIPNGVEITEAEKRHDDFAIVLGRICPEKNQHAALEAGFLAGTPVVMGGHVFPWKEHERYFREKVVPLLEQKRNGTQHTFCGPLSRTKSRQLLAYAKCLLHPTLAPETSSLVAMEAMAAGTPVIAYRSGALPEIVEDGVTGFLVNSVNEMAAAIHRVHVIRPEACRAAVTGRFSKQRMVEQYFGLYQKMIHAPIHQRLYA
jgi:glycosyltransferase involved in cell wall biosynthesis